MGTLYSLPFAFAEMPINVTSFDTNMSTLIATDVDDTKYESYEKIKTVKILKVSNVRSTIQKNANINLAAYR